MWRLRPSVLRAAWWAWRSVRHVRRELPREGIRARVSAPPALPASAGVGVAGVLRRLSPTCLERALVAQRWLAEHDCFRDVVIGGHIDGGPGEDRQFLGHAWIEGSEPDSAERYTELLRIPAR